MPKRANNEGTFSRHPHGLWQARLGYTDEDGKRRRVSVYGATRAEAREKLDEARRRITAGMPPRDARITVAAWCETWLQTAVAASSRRPSTKSLMRGLVERHVTPLSIGGIALSRLRPSHIDAWVLELRARGRARARRGGNTGEAGLSEATIQRTFRVLRLALDGAVRDGLLARNPARAVQQPAAVTPEARVLRPHEVGAILRSAAELDRLRLERGGYRTHHFTLFALIAATGIRRGEALALRWDDVDFAKGTVAIRGTLSRVDGRWTVTQPKTRASRRVLSPAASLLELLAQHRDAQEVDRVAAGSEWVETGHVFATATGRAIDPRSALRAFQTAAARAGIADVSIHTLRHSAATALLDGGVHLRAVSELLGHAGTQITAEVYAHLTTPTARRAMDLLSAAYQLGGDDDATPA